MSIPGSFADLDPGSDWGTTVHTASLGAPDAAEVG
jgi:hypothetical protein